MTSHLCCLVMYMWKENYLIISFIFPQDYLTVHIFPHFYCVINLYPVCSAETSFFLPQGLSGSCSPRVIGCRGIRRNRKPGFLSQFWNTKICFLSTKHKAQQGILWWALSCMCSSSGGETSYRVLAWEIDVRHPVALTNHQNEGGNLFAPITLTEWQQWI